MTYLLLFIFSGVISQAWGNDFFQAADEHLLSFRKAELIEILGKAPDNGELWLGKVSPSKLNYTYYLF